MNWTDLAVLAIILGSMYFGWKKGFIVAVIEFVKWIASIFIARVFYVQFTDTLVGIFGDPTAKISKHVSNYLYEMLGYDPVVSKPLEMAQMNTALTSLKLPQDFEGNIKATLMDNVVNTTGGFVQVATDQMSKMVLYGLGFLLLVLLLIVIFGFLQVVGKVISKLPIIKELNHSGGVLLGAIIGLVSVYFIMAMLGYLKTFQWAGDTLAMIEKSKFAIYFYKYNILQYMFNHMLIKGHF
ncbi:CvpA family protein [Fusibacter bizertensis]